jgi:hypothetical protein
MMTGNNLKYFEEAVILTKKCPMTYEEYEKRVIELFLDLYPKDKQEAGMERLNALLEDDPQFIEGLYAETCFRYDHPEIYSETCKKVFGDYLLNSIPVNTLNMLLGGNLESYGEE